MHVFIRSLMLTLLLTLLPNPGRADTKKEEADKKKKEADKKKHEADKKKHEAEVKKKHEAEKKKHEAEEKKKREAEAKRKHAADEKKKHAKHETWHGMIVTVNGSGGKGSVNIKRANESGKTFEVDGKTQISGVGTGFGSLKKGQIVTVHYLDKHNHAAKLVIDKQAEKTPNIVAKNHLQGTVEKVAADKYGDNGEIWVKNSKGQTKKFRVRNETKIDYKKDGKDIDHTLQGILKGQHVKIAYNGKDAVHIEAIMK